MSPLKHQSLSRDCPAERLAALAAQPNMPTTCSYAFSHLINPNPVEAAERKCSEIRHFASCECTENLFAFFGRIWYLFFMPYVQFSGVLFQ
ncbi:MAG: hypothetical protein E7211_19705 [Clostridium lundense]|nr:hypothetical protein [Clostridium lundense]